MSSQELLDKIESFIAEPCDELRCLHCSPWKALREVLKLHWHEGWTSATGEELEPYCLECPNLSHYPCLTFKAIEKVLI